MVKVLKLLSGIHTIYVRFKGVNNLKEKLTIVGVFKSTDELNAASQLVYFLVLLDDIGLYFGQVALQVI